MPDVETLTFYSVQDTQGEDQVLFAAGDALLPGLTSVEGWGREKARGCWRKDPVRWQWHVPPHMGKHTNGDPEMDRQASVTCLF